MKTNKANPRMFLPLLLLCAATAVGAVDYIITVGRAAHRFNPDSLTAAVGDTIIFEFYPTNHSVVRGAFDYPCIPYELVTPEVDGFFSGFRPVKTIPNDPPRYSVLVNDTNPIFFYCSAPDSCDHWGMAGVVNPRADTPIANYQARAKNASFVLQPGQEWPSEAEGITQPPPVPTSVPAGSTSTPALITVTPAPTPTPTPQPTTSAPLSTGGIAGVTIGGVAVIGLICSLFFFLGRRRNEAAATTATVAAPPTHSIIYEKPPIGYLPSISPPPHSMYGDGMGAYRSFGPDPRTFPPGMLTSDGKPLVYRTSHHGRPVEIGSPSSADERDNWRGSQAGSFMAPRPGSTLGNNDDPARWAVRGPESTARE